MSHNQIADIEDDALGRLEILVTLQIHDNQITTVPLSLPSSLTHLFMHNNQIADIQPAVFAQLDHLETLDLSGNKLTYLPGLPLPRLLTLNLRTSGLRGLSQSVVKTSPELKELLLEGNPIKCTDLMGIAEWTTACRSEMPTDILGNSDSRFSRARTVGGLLQTIAVSRMCCGRPAVYSHISDFVKKRVACKREITRKSADALVKPKKRSRKAKMEEIWRALSMSNFTATNKNASLDISESQNILNSENSTKHIQDERSATSVGPSLASVIVTTSAPSNDITLKSISNHFDNRNQQQSTIPNNHKHFDVVSISNPKETYTTPSTIKQTFQSPVNFVRDDESLLLASNKLTPSFGTSGKTTRMSKAMITETTEKAGSSGELWPYSGRIVDNNQHTQHQPTVQRLKHSDGYTNNKNSNIMDDNREPNSGENIEASQGDKAEMLYSGSIMAANHEDMIQFDDPSTVASNSKNASVAGNHADEAQNIPNKTNIAYHPKCTHCTDSNTTSADINNIYVAEQSLVAVEISLDNRQSDPKHTPDGPSLNLMPKDKDIDQMKNVQQPPGTKNINEEHSVMSSPEAGVVIVHSSHHLHNRMNIAKDSNHDDNEFRRIITEVGTSTSSGLPEQWNAVRVTVEHPGLFIVMGVTIGMFVTLLLIQVYRCARPWQIRIVEVTGEEDDPVVSTHRDTPAMELLGDDSRTIHYTEAPIELW